jgi:hypothetical protein
MPPRRPTVRFEVEWSSEAWAELRTLSASERRPVLDAAAGLARGERRPAPATVNTILEVRTEGDHRLLYRVVDPMSSPVAGAVGGRPRVEILCALVTGATGAAVARPGPGELRRRGATLRQIGGGIPHQVVRRAWLAEMRGSSCSDGSAMPPAHRKTRLDG